MRLKIELPMNWAQQSNADGPVTFYRESSTSPFQVSWAEYQGLQPLPEITQETLKKLAADFGKRSSFGALEEVSGGACRFGNFGSAVFSSAEYPRIQVWFVSDGRNQILATHICSDAPDALEISEIQQIAESLALGPEESA